MDADVDGVYKIIGVDADTEVDGVDASIGGMFTSEALDETLRSFVCPSINQCQGSEPPNHQRRRTQIKHG